MARLARIRVYPVKSLDPLSLETATVGTNGGLSHDRRWAIEDETGCVINGKRTAAMHRIASSFDPHSDTLTVGIRAAEDRQRFDLETNRAGLEGWLSEYFGQPTRLRRNDDGGFPDDTTASGPTVVSTATLETVASWFELPIESARRRFRANLEVDGVTPFWEDRLVGRGGQPVRFRIGDVAFDGVTVCQRCVVPTRDPDTGERTDGFRKGFVQMREETLPEWAARDQFDHYYRLMINTTVPEPSWGEPIRVGDAVEVESRPRPR